MSEDYPAKKGIYCSFALVVATIFLSLLFQHYLSKDMDSTDAWSEYCPQDGDYKESCLGNSAVYRFSFALAIFFVVQALLTFLDPQLFDTHWPLKTIGYGLLVFGFYFTPGDVFDTNGYAWFARFAAAFFIVLQQIILLDFAYSWNSSWVKNSEESHNNKWLVGLVIISGLLFAASFTVIGILYWQFSGCPENEAIISITLILSVAVTVFQLFTPGEGSLLTSGIMVAYATFLCYSAVVLNPNTDCNPTLASSYQTITEIIGVVITLISLAYTAASAVYSAPTTLGALNSGPTLSLNHVLTGQLDGGEGGATRVDTPASGRGDGSPQLDYSSEGLSTLMHHICIVFIMIAAYYAMVITNWATEQSNSNISNSKDGKIGMWMQATAQWIALLLYAWSLIAPRIFPDRDFGRG